MSVIYTPLDRQIDERTHKAKPSGKFAPGTIYISNEGDRILKVKEDFSKTEFKMVGFNDVKNKWLIGRNYHIAKSDDEILEACTRIYIDGRPPVPGFEHIFKFIEDKELKYYKDDFENMIKHSNYAIIDIVRITYEYFKKLPKHINPDKLMNKIDPRVNFN